MYKTLGILILLFMPFFTNVSFASLSDIEYSWYKESIERLSNEKIINGFPDGTFGPEKPITRAEILKIIIQASGNGLGEIPMDRCFPDVDVSMWYHGFICRAYMLRVANGFSDGTFKPNNQVTTLEALAFGFRAFSIPIPKSGTGELWYEPLRKAADEAGIIGMHAYTPETLLSRGKAADIITRIRTYKQTQKPVSYGTLGCSIGKDLQTKNTISVAGKNREYLLYVPRNYLKVKQYPLVVAVHGRTNSNEQVREYMGFEGSRRSGIMQNDFIVAYPAGLPAGTGARSWSEAENILFFDAMIREISDAYCIDRSEIFVAGHSLGGWFTHKLACLRGDVIRGMAGVGSAGYSGACKGPVASLLYQNVDDKLSPYASGVSGREIRKSVNQCKTETTDIKIGSLTCKQSVGCSPESTVIWCEGYTGLLGDPHSWPTGGGNDILNFFRGLR